jgi:hypothetical protein
MQQAFDALTHHRQQTTFQFQETNAAIKALENELAKPEPIIVPFPSFMRKRVEQAIDNSINSKGMSTHDSKARVLISDLKLMLLIADLAAQQLDKQDFYPDWDMLKPYHERIAELEAQLAKPEQEPVKCICGYSIGHPLVPKCTCTPPRKEWVGLTDDEKTAFCMQAEFSDLTERQMYDVVEAKLKEKNNAV